MSDGLLDFSEGELCEMVVVVNKRGLHARAAAKFVKAVEMFESDISVAKDDMRVSGKSIMGLMMLAASQGSQLKLCAGGPDSEEAIAALAELVKRGFDEE